MQCGTQDFLRDVDWLRNIRPAKQILAQGKSHTIIIVTLCVDVVRIGEIFTKQNKIFVSNGIADAQ